VIRPAAPLVEPRLPPRVGRGFITLYALAFMGTSLVFIAPVLVSLALKVDSLVGIERAPTSLALVTGVGSLVSMVGNPFFGKLSDRTSSPLGMRRPWMVIGLIGGSGGILVVDLALVADVLPEHDNAKDLGVFNIAAALPFSVAPAIAPAVLALGHGNYGVLYAVAGLCALTGAVAILPVRRVH
jgi:MFS family permease